jgi:ribosomal-protein-alanine N-acetyltransferase
MHRIMANVRPDNERSLRVLDRLGFEREGYAKKYLRANGVWCDHVLTALTNDSWTEPPLSEG